MATSDINKQTYLPITDSQGKYSISTYIRYLSTYLHSTISIVIRTCVKASTKIVKIINGQVYTNHKSLPVVL